MAALSSAFLQSIAAALQEEEVDVYALSLYSLNTDDLNYFREADREKVKRIFKVLIEDTQHHAELLRLMVELGGR